MATAVKQVSHPLFARGFDRTAWKIEDRGQRENRRRALAGLSGRVIEVGAGNGLNFPLYPETVSEVVAVEPEQFLRDRAREAAAKVSVKVAVVDGTAERLPVGDASFDAGVASLVLCSIFDQARALAELRRVIRPGGELRFYEHVRAQRPLAFRAQRAFDLVWNLVAGGCHTSRDTLAAIRDAGFELEHCERMLFKPYWFAAATAPHILGVARRPLHDKAARREAEGGPRTSASRRDQERLERGALTNGGGQQ
jgi:ubiquinone/menaquinone biosynthesis C-methylase UbiE